MTGTSTRTPTTVASAAPDWKPNSAIAVATMGIVANDMYPYVKSGQLRGLMNSRPGAAEYLSLLDPDNKGTSPRDNSMSLGKVFLLVLVLVGNAAFVVVRWAEITGHLPRGRVLNTVQRSLPRWAIWVKM